MTVGVRPLRPADREFVLDLGRRTAGSSVASDRPASSAVVELALERLVDSVESHSHAALVAEAEGRPVGFVLMIDDMPDEITSMPQGFIAYMAVEPALQGRGIGKKLLEAAEREARRHGLPYICLMVTEENAAARALYAGAGYRTERRLLCKAL